jgi:hypothetical protein
MGRACPSGPVQRHSYAAKDIITYAGAAYVALRDNPTAPSHDEHSGLMEWSPRGGKGR